MTLTMPVQCSSCGELIELNDAKFFTNFCDCKKHYGGGCDHGLCKECAEIEERSIRKPKKKSK